MAGRVRDFAVFLVDPAGIIRSGSPAAAAMKGFRTDEFALIIEHCSADGARASPALNAPFDTAGARVRCSCAA